MTQDTAGLLQGFEEAGKEKGISPRFLEFYKRLVSAQLAAEPSLEIAHPLTKDAADKRLKSGRPLLDFDSLSLDWSKLGGVLSGVVAIFSDYPELFGELPQSLKQGGNISLSKDSVRAWAEHGRLPSQLTARDASEELLLEAVLNATLRPLWLGLARILASYVDQECWRRDYCPVCGSRPDLAFIEKEGGARWLMCSRCDARWLFQRLQCPYCGTEDQNALAYFTDDTGLYRLYVCEKCHTYIKAVDIRQTNSNIELSLERVLTLDMDKQAQDRGYKPGHAEILTVR